MVRMNADALMAGGVWEGGRKSERERNPEERDG